MHRSIRVVGHIRHFALTLTEHFDYDPDTVAVHIDVHFLEWLQFSTIFILDDDRFRSADLKFVSFTPHRFNQDAKVQLSAPGY